LVCAVCSTSKLVGLFSLIERISNKDDFNASSQLPLPG
jgi:hypothetical protein